MEKIDNYLVHIEEEYGYREWLWSPSMTVEELKVWWKSIPTVAPYFFEGPVNFPGEVHQIYFHEPLKFSFVEEGAKRTVMPLHPDPLTLPEDTIYIHIHEDSDSYLMVNGESYTHAGSVSMDEYNDDDYSPPPEVKDAWDKAISDDIAKKMPESKEDK
jgi:hypothetical protein